MTAERKDMKCGYMGDREITYSDTYSSEKQATLLSWLISLVLNTILPTEMWIIIQQCFVLVTQSNV